jgi:cytochrome c oxidase subunit 1
MPRRIPDYALQFAEFNAISTIGAFILGFSQLLFAWNIWRCVNGRRLGLPKASDEVWDDNHAANGLEWTLSSPPPYHSWEKAPQVS